MSTLGLFLVGRHWNWSCPDREKILHLSLLDVGSFRGADFNIDCSLVVAKLVKGLSVSGWAMHKFDMEQNNMKIKYQYPFIISDWFAVLENMDADVHILGILKILKSMRV